MILLNKLILSSVNRCSVAFKGLMLLQIILEIAIALAIKIDQLRLSLTLNNYIVAHIVDYLHHFSSGSSLYRIDDDFTA